MRLRGIVVSCFLHRCLSEVLISVTCHISHGWFYSLDGILPQFNIWFCYTLLNVKKWMFTEFSLHVCCMCSAQEQVITIRMPSLTATSLLRSTSLKVPLNDINHTRYFHHPSRSTGAAAYTVR